MPADGRSAKIRDVAEAAGVSPTTVSHTFSGRRRIAEPTRQKVLKAARSLGYVPNAHARKLRLGTSGMIGLALRPRSVYAGEPDAAETFNRLAGSSATEALRRGLGLVHVPDLDEDGANLVPMDGCIIAHPCAGDRTVERFTAIGLPFVLIDPDPSRPELPWRVGADYGRGIRDALEAASGGGAREVTLLVGSEPNAWNLTARAEHAAHAHRHGQAERAGHSSDENNERDASGNDAKTGPTVFELGESLTVDDVRDVVEQALEQIHPPAAIVYSTSDSTPIVLQAIHERGLRVPDDISLAALTDTVHTRTAQPPVTGLDLAHEQVASAAVELLLRRIAGDGPPVGPVRIEPTLTRRASTAF